MQGARKIHPGFRGYLRITITITIGVEAVCFITPLGGPEYVELDRSIELAPSIQYSQFTNPITCPLCLLRHVVHRVLKHLPYGARIRITVSLDRYRLWHLQKQRWIWKKASQLSGISVRTIQRYRKVAREQGFDPLVSTYMDLKYMEDAHRSGALKKMTAAVEEAIIESVTKDRNGREKSCWLLASEQEVDVCAESVRRMLKQRNF